MIRNRFRDATLAAAVVLGLTSAASADDPRAAALASPWQTYFRRLASEYRLAAGERNEKLELVAAPVLKWTQPVRGGQDGAVYLWLKGGRPAVVGTFFIWPSSETQFGVSHELHALTSDKLQGDWRSAIRWRPADEQLTWSDVPDTSPPSHSAAKRSIEARQIVRRFAAKSTDRNGQSSELRLQPRAFFEYESAAADDAWQGGSLFSLAHGTDMEIIVWLDAVKDGDKLAWKYACLRMSDLALAVTLDGKEVWTTELAKYNQYDRAYLCTSPEFLEQPPTETP